jgi:sugar phosphate isomerase/epimerase
MQRRTFLQQSAILSAGIIAMPEMAFSKNQKIGLQLYTLRESVAKDVPGVFSQIAKAGYSELEMFGLSAENKFFGHTVKEVAELLKQNNLTSPSGHYMPEKFLFNNGNGDDVKNLCDVANALGNSYLIIPWMSEEKRNSIDKYKALAERINKAGEICKAANLQLAYHNHDFEFADFNGEHGYDILLKNTDSSLVKMEMDLYWVVRAGYDPIALFKSNPGRFHLWHVKDMNKNDKTQNTEVCNGSLDFKTIFANAKLAGVKHYIVEQENNDVPGFYGSIAASNKAVKKLLKKVG